MYHQLYDKLLHGFSSTCICDRSTMIGLVSSRSSIFCCLRGVFFGGLTYSSTLKPDGVPGLGSRVGQPSLYIFLLHRGVDLRRFFKHFSVVITVPLVLFAGVFRLFCISWRPRGSDSSPQFFSFAAAFQFFELSYEQHSAATKVVRF